MYILIISLLISTISVSAHEFIQKPKAKKVSLYTIKEQAGQAFAQQLQDTAAIVELLGRLQAKKVALSDQTRKQLGALQDKLKTYKVQFADLLTLTVCPILCEERMLSADDRLFAELTELIGAIQHCLIKHLNELLEDSGVIFIKKNLSALQNTVTSVSSYTQIFQELKTVLYMLDKPPVCKTKQLPAAKKEFSKD